MALPKSAEQHPPPPPDLRHPPSPLDSITQPMPPPESPLDARVSPEAEDKPTAAQKVGPLYSS